MNLKNFEEQFDDVILNRGLDYYKSGYIKSLELDGDTWVAVVSGSDYYEVTVALSGDDVSDTSCDCPYDWGAYCKHQAAVLYALRDMKNIPAPKKKATKKQNLEAVLGKLDKQELLSILLEFAGRDRRMKEELLLRYSEKSDAVGYAKGVIKSSINAVKRRGFVEYADVGHATDGADTVLEMANDLLAADDIFTAVSLCIAVLDEMMNLLDMCDDSNGYVGGTISEAIEKMNESTSFYKSAEKEVVKLFDIILKHAVKPMYNGWTHWRMEILTACVPLCTNTINRSKLETYLDEQNTTDSTEWGREYERKERQNLQYNIIKHLDGNSAAEEYIDRHLENSDFRRIAVLTAIDRKQYDKALNLCLDAENGHSRNSNWKKYRYEIYEKTGDVSAQKILANELLIDGDFDYFAKLKALYKKDEWPPVLQEILEELGSNDRRGVYVKILTHEKLKIRLLDYCKSNIHTIEKYYPHLLPECKKDVGVLFVKHIRHQAASANDRNQYRKVCDIIRHYRKACGNIAFEIRDELAAQYVKRPAFLDELGKV